jgi:drug/metabolite transporter (DMT)-like permease
MAASAGLHKPCKVAAPFLLRFFPPSMSDLTKGYLLGLAAVVIFGLTLPFTRIAVSELDPYAVSLWRAVVATGVAAIFLVATRQPWPRPSDLARLAATGAGVVLGFPVLSSVAMQWAPAAHGGVVLGALPLATAIMGAVLTGERPAPAFWAWSVIGSSLVIVYALWDGGAELHAADTLLVLAVISAAAGYAIGGDLSRRLGGWQVISWVLVVSLPLTLPLALWRLPELNWQASWPAWGSFLYLAVMSQFAGFFFWNAGLAKGGVAKVGQVQLLQTFVTLAAAALMLGEALTARTLVFAVAVAAAVWFGRKARVVRRG